MDERWLCLKKLSFIVLSEIGWTIPFGFPSNCNFFMTKEKNQPEKEKWTPKRKKLWNRGRPSPRQRLLESKCPLDAAPSRGPQCPPGPVPATSSAASRCGEQIFRGSGSPLVRRCDVAVASYTRSCKLTALVPLAAAFRYSAVCQWPPVAPHLAHNGSVPSAPRNNRCSLLAPCASESPPSTIPPPAKLIGRVFGSPRFSTRLLWRAPTWTSSRCAVALSALLLLWYDPGSIRALFLLLLPRTLSLDLDTAYRWRYIRCCCS